MALRANIHTNTALALATCGKDFSLVAIWSSGGIICAPLSFITVHDNICSDGEKCLPCWMSNPVPGMYTRS
jgi:hypothetical protein